MPAAGGICVAEGIRRSAIAPAAVQELRQGRGSLQNLLAGARVAGLEPDEREQELLQNLNTPEDCACLMGSDWRFPLFAIRLFSLYNSRHALKIKQCGVNGY